MGILGKRWKDPSDSEYSPLNPSDDRFTRGAEEARLTQVARARGILESLAPEMENLIRLGVSVTTLEGWKRASERYTSFLDKLAQMIGHD